MWAVNLNILYKYENIIHTCYISYETLSLPCASVAEMSIGYIKRLIVSLKKKLHQKKGDVCNKQLSNTLLVATSMSWRQSSVILRRLGKDELANFSPHARCTSHCHMLSKQIN